MKEKTFVVSDQSLNTYGFRVLTDGIDTASFEQNPTMLYNHQDDRVIGLWSNVRKEGERLLADPEFDMEDPYAAGIAGKVARHVLRAASVGLRILSGRNVKDGDKEVFEVTKSELREISVVSIPANKSALRLYDANNKEITAAEAIALLDSRSITNQPKNNKMELKDLLKLLGLADTATTNEVNAVVATFNSASTELADTKKKLADIEAKIAADRKAEAVKLIDAAIAEKRIAAKDKEPFLEMSETHHDLMKSALLAIPKPQNLTQVAQLGGMANEDDAVSLYDKYDKAGTLAKLKRENPEEFERIFEAKHGRKPSK